MENLPGTTRRGFLRLVGAMGAAATLTGTLAACGTTPAQTTPTAGGSAAPSAAPTITGGIIASSAHGESAVCTCRSARQTFTHGSP